MRWFGRLGVVVALLATSCAPPVVVPEVVAPRAWGDGLAARLRAAGALPDSTLVALWSPSLERLLARLELEQLGELRRRVAFASARDLGFDLTHLEALADAGIDPQGPVALGWLGRESFAIVLPLRARARLERVALVPPSVRGRPSEAPMPLVEGAFVSGGEAAALALRDSEVTVFLGHEALEHARDYAARGRARRLGATPTFERSVASMGAPGEIEAYVAQSAFQDVAKVSRAEWVESRGAGERALEAAFSSALERARKQRATVAEIAALDAAHRERLARLKLASEAEPEERTASGIEGLVASLEFGREAIILRGTVAPAVPIGAAVPSAEHEAARVRATLEGFFQGIFARVLLRPQLHGSEWSLVPAASEAPKAEVAAHAPRERSEEDKATPSRSAAPAPPHVSPAAEELASVQRALLELDIALGDAAVHARRRPAMVASKVRFTPRWQGRTMHFEARLTTPRASLGVLLAELFEERSARGEEAIAAALERRRVDLSRRRDALLDALFRVDEPKPHEGAPASPTATGPATNASSPPSAKAPDSR